MSDISTPEPGNPTTRRGGRGRTAGGSLRRNWPVLAGAAALVVASSTGGAVAAGLITSSKIKDYTIQNRDIDSNAISVRNIRSGSVQARDLTSAARRALQGQPGAPGSKWLSGAGAPGNLAASNGDWYLDTTAQVIYTRVGGAWGFVVNITGATGPKGDKGDTGTAGANGTNGTNGATGTNGADGKAGAVWFNGTGVPASTLGVDGDWYVDTATGQAYQKADGSWTFRVNLKGAQGEKGLTGEKGTTGDKGDKGDAGTNGTNGDDGLDGATWYTGAGAPASSLGKNTDLYLDTVTSDVYKKTSGAWSLLTNIKGQKGDPGTNGTNGTNGAAGTNGTNGADGTVWLTGAGAPSAAVGNNGDLYLNTTNGDVYQKAAGAWGSSIANLTGPAGSGGSGGGTTWLSGKNAPGMSEGANGNYYLATNTGVVYLKSSGAWASIYTPPVASGSAVLAVQATKTSNAQVLPLAQGTNLGDQVTYNNVVRQNTAVGTYNAGTSTFTASVEGLYQVQASGRSADHPTTASSTVSPLLWASVDNAAINSASTTITDYPPALGSNLPAGAKGRGFMQITVYLTAGQTIRIMGLSANSSTLMQPMLTDGSSQLLITKM